ncbi:hypothetical protein THAOC_23436 [Thalassiosira oceanica]|uniref:Uncharacterized protein n=1 Tax=Thalassiosira oceanica TaxID=159749 RepID=K0RS53_THAOC|nr:hypothetical protein THAOC_23436 [Thalassiosira oceanica]|eukprot:EJK56638.1 hypothetical protein THAOC_23436 [Thalassiosira oceanica]
MGSLFTETKVGEALPIKKVNIHRSFGPSMVSSTSTQDDRSAAPTKSSPPLPPAGRERGQDRVVVGGDSRSSPPAARLWAFWAESASGSSHHLPSQHQRPTTTPDRAAKHARPVGLRCAQGRPELRRRVRSGTHLADAQPGGKARRHDWALVDTGRTGFVVGRGNRVEHMLGHDTGRNLRPLFSLSHHAHLPTPLRSHPLAVFWAPANGVYPARPSALYTLRGPLGQSVASVDQTTIDASSVVDLSAPMCLRPSHSESRVTFAGRQRTSPQTGYREIGHKRPLEKEIV